MREIFVFGSNLQGIHGAGAAKAARRQYGAVLGKGVGLQGNSYAIPTKATPSETLSLHEISKHVMEFLDFAERHPMYTFNVTPIGCGLAGYVPEQIAPMFINCPENVKLPDEFQNCL